MRPKATRLTVRLTTPTAEDEEALDNCGNRNESSEQSELPAQAAKRPRIAQPESRAKKKYVRGKQGGLQGIMEMPMEVFTEIMQHLGPGELVTLTRSNKFFRNMLLRQSAVHIWQRVQKNVPGLPPCPSGMCEPQYAALLFSKYCTLCGSHATAKPDPYLWARLCASCRESKLVDRVDILTYHKLGIDHSLVPYSPVIKPKNKANSTRGYSDQEYSLTQDVENVLRTQCDLLNASDEKGLLRWICNRRDEMGIRFKEASRLNQYLQSAEELSGKQPRNAKQKRRREIYERLRKIGWNDDDLRFDGKWTSKEWDSLVDAPGPLTDEAWNHLLPELTRLLNSNRDHHTQLTILNQIRRKRQHIEDLLTHLRRTTHPFAQIINAVGIDFSRPLEDFPEPFRQSCALLQNPFPASDVIISWESLGDMPIKDLDNPGLDQLFAERRAQIETAIKEWRDSLEQQLVERFWAQAKKCETEVLLTVNGSSSLTAHLSSNTRFLLRADTIFRRQYPGPSGKFDGCFYPALSDLACGLHRAYISLHGYMDQGSGFQSHLGIRPRDYHRHTEAQDVAKSILKDLGMPDATHFELIAMGKRFACGRCQESDHTWITIIHHYLHQLRNWNLQHNDLTVNTMRYPIMHHNTHDLESEHNSKRLAHILAEGGDTDAPKDTSADKKVCLLCAFTEYASYQSCMDYMLVHMRDVHGIENPVEGLHYGRGGIPEAWLTKWEVFHDDQAAASTGPTAEILRVVSTSVESLPRVL